jgi:hypothetical protein
MLNVDRHNTAQQKMSDSHVLKQQHLNLNLPLAAFPSVASEPSRVHQYPDCVRRMAGSPPLVAEMFLRAINLRGAGLWWSGTSSILVNTFTRVARGEILGSFPVKWSELGCIYEELGTSADVQGMRFIELGDTTGSQCYWIEKYILGRS